MHLNEAPFFDLPFPQTIQLSLLFDCLPISFISEELLSSPGPTIKIFLSQHVVAWSTQISFGDTGSFPGHPFFTQLNFIDEEVLQFLGLYLLDGVISYCICRPTSCTYCSRQFFICIGPVTNEFALVHHSERHAFLYKIFQDGGLKRLTWAVKCQT